MEGKRGLPPEAHRPLAEGETYQPYVGARQSLPEFTVKAMVAGILFGILFGAANAYLGLRAGLTISTSIPVAVMTVAAFRTVRAFGGRTSILEANLSQTIGSASSSLASGVIFTLPALYMWAAASDRFSAPSLLTMTTLAMAGGLIGVLFMVPLRRFLIAREHGHLPYPEGTACAEVLVASESTGSQARPVFYGLAIGAAVKAVYGWAKVLPSTVHFPVPLLPKGELGASMSAALYGVGYILGPRVATIMVSGGLLSSLVLIPAIAIWGNSQGAPVYPETERLISQMSPHDLWTRYVRYIGAGAVATAGLVTLIRNIPTMVESFRIGAQQIKKRVGGDAVEEERTSRDLPLRTVGIALAVVVLLLAAIPAAFGVLGSFPVRLFAGILVAIFAFFFVTVASRIVGLVGVTSNPTSGMTIATLLATSTVFLMLGWTDAAGKTAAICVGCVVAIAASISGDTSQDLKTGFLLGATPRRQQIGELIGVATSAVFVCLAVQLLGKTYTFGSPELAAPQATLMKLVIDGVLDGDLPWGLVAIGVGIALVAELLRVPSLPFAVGVYLPVSVMVTVFLGGMTRFLLTRRAKEGAREERRDRGILLGSGFVGGEGLLGVAIAGVALAFGKTRGFGTGWVEWFPGAPNVVAAIAFGVLVWIFARLVTRRGGARTGQ